MHGERYASERILAEADNENPLLADLKAMLRQHADSHKRSQQVALGPSQIGHPCARNVISGLIGGKEHTVNPKSDPLPSYIGVASHAAMELAAKLDNEKIIPGGLEGYDRWLTERKVTVTEGLSGTCDLYDTWTDTVIDYKFVGTTAMTEYRKLVAAGKPPSTIYQVQGHLYGRGYRNEGFNVKRVGIWLLPRSGYLSTSILWLEDYNDELVTQQISRYYDLIMLAHDLDLDNHPERLDMIPITPYQCGWCPWFSVSPRTLEDDPYACAGGTQYQRPRYRL